MSISAPAELTASAIQSEAKVLKLWTSFVSCLWDFYLFFNAALGETNKNTKRWVSVADQPSCSTHICLGSLITPAKWGMIPHLAFITSQKANHFLVLFCYFVFFLQLIGSAQLSLRHIKLLVQYVVPNLHPLIRALSLTSILGMYCADYKWANNQRGFGGVFLSFSSCWIHIFSA